MNGNRRRSPDRVLLGEVSGVYGVRGWVKIHSWTSPIEAILDYRPWLLGDALQEVTILAGRLQGKTVIAALPGVEDREQARALIGTEIAVARSSMPDPPAQSWYWSDLVGLEVRNREGELLGVIERMMETGAHDVMVVGGDRERLIPFVPGVYVDEVDLDARQVSVAWPADYLE